MSALKEIIKSLTFSGWKLQGRKKFQGLDISIENRKGSVRRGVDKDGNEWKTKMHADYGYVRGTVGKDKDHLDCYLGQNPESRRVFIVHQNNPVTGKYDEDKCMLGFDTPEEAKALYMKQYDRPGFFGEMDETDIDTFKEHALDKKSHGKKLVIKRSKNPELEVGIKVEMEHTDDIEEAKKIALDHIEENPKYYSKLIAAGLVDEKDALDEAKRQGIKKSNSQKKTIAIDFDGVINSFTSGWKGAGETDRPVEGAREAIKALIEAGFTVIIFSNRANTKLGKQTIRNYLSELDIPEGIEITDRKPIADVYLDDRAVTFDGDWITTLDKLKSFKPWMQKAHEWQSHKYIKKIGNKYFYTEEEIRNFTLQKRSDGFYYMDETKITNDPEKARQFVEKVREQKPAERVVQVGEKVQIKPDHVGSIGRGVVGIVKEMGDDFARVMDAAGRMFRVPTTALVFARSLSDGVIELRKSEDGKHRLVAKKIIVTRKDGITYQTTTHVNPTKGAKKVRYVVRVGSGPTREEVETLSKEIDARTEQKYGINFGKTPKVLDEHGIPAGLPLKIRSADMRKVMEDKHGLTKDQLLAAQKALHKPVAVFISATRMGRSVIVTDARDDLGRPIVFAVVPGGDFYGREANVILSVYGRNWFANFVESARSEKRVVYEDEGRLDALLSSVGRKQYPGALTGEAPIGKYSDDGELVKSLRLVLPILEKARKNLKLIPQKRMITRDGRTFQTTVWVLPGDSGPAQGGFDFDSETEEPKKEPVVMDEEQFLARNGASRQDIGDAALHKNRGRHSDKAWKKIVEQQAEKDRDLIVRRAELREEFKKKVESGEIREPTAHERRVETANGHPDHEATHAARRLLEKHGYDWRTGKKKEPEISSVAEKIKKEFSEEQSSRLSPKKAEDSKEVGLQRKIYNLAVEKTWLNNKQRTDTTKEEGNYIDKRLLEIEKEGRACTFELEKIAQERSDNLDSRLEVAYKMARPKTMEGFFNSIAERLGGDKELQEEFANRFNIDASLPGPERKAQILERITDEYRKQKAAHKERNERDRQGKAELKKEKENRFLSDIESMAMDAENAMQDQIKQRDESDKILPGEQMSRKDLEAFKRRMDKEAEDRAEWHRTHKDPPKVVDPEWTTLEGQDVLRINGSKFVAAPITGKKNASRFVVFNIDERKELAQLKYADVFTWLRKKYENEIEDGSIVAPQNIDNETEKKYDEFYEKRKSWLPARINDADYTAYKALSAEKKAGLAKKAFTDGTFDEAFKRVTQLADDSLAGQYGKKEYKAGWSSIKSTVKWFIENRIDEMAKQSQTGNVFQKPFAMKYGGYQAMRSARYAANGKGKDTSSSNPQEFTGIDLAGEVWSNDISRVTWDSPVGVITLERGQYKSDEVKIGISVSEAGNALISHAKKQGII